MEPTQLGLGLLLALAIVAAPTVLARIRLSRAKHPSLAGHARFARRVAAWLPGYELPEDAIYAVDGVPVDVAARRRRGFERLAELYRERFPVTAAATAASVAGLPDLEFTSHYRVPWPFSAHVRRHLAAGAFVAESRGMELIDLDGNRLYDLTGSYGVNLLGYDTYKECIARAAGKAAALGPVLGPYHPLVAANARRLIAISGLDAVSFHMSGTEAVMQAVRLARYHTGRSHLVRFCGAYHGWWGDVQPGIGNPQPARDTYTLRDLSAASLKVLATRRDIACVLVNPLQALHPNAAAPADSALVDSSRSAGFDRAAYSDWLRCLREVCSKRGIVLIFDEVFVGFRLAPGGAQEFFGVRADLVTYGKTLGGGLPVGVLCGRADLMRRFRPRHPADICFARGTFNSHPYVMAAMAEFLDLLERPEVRATYRDNELRWDARASALNTALAADALPVRVVNLVSIWTVVYLLPGRYNWMLQYYLRAEGIALSWVGTGRIVFSHDYGDAEFAEVQRRFVTAARTMAADGWWWQGAGLTNRSIRRQVLRELLAHRR